MVDPGITASIKMVEKIRASGYDISTKLASINASIPVAEDDANSARSFSMPHRNASSTTARRSPSFDPNCQDTDPPPIPDLSAQAFQHIAYDTISAACSAASVTLS